LANKLKIVGIYRKRLSRVLGLSRSMASERGYVVMSYGGHELGRLAISDEMYEQMRADGTQVLLNGGRR
jgi:hypothetical protein